MRTPGSRTISSSASSRASGNLYIDISKHELLREDILSEIVRMLEARYYFSERVYYHHAKVAAGAILAVDATVSSPVTTRALAQTANQGQASSSAKRCQEAQRSGIVPLPS